MTGILTRFRVSRFAWTVLVAFYFVVFFRNFFADAAPGRMVLPLVFACLLVLWLAVEYYFGSPFFQSGVVEPSPLWRGVFAFYVYPFFGYVAADSLWWHWTQIPFPAFVLWIPGVVLFALGAGVRLNLLFALARMASKQSGRGDGRSRLPAREFTNLFLQRRCRHPRYLATLLQLVGAALAFGSWGGLALVLIIGLPLILVQAKHEDRQLRSLLKGEYERYVREVPLFWPRPGRNG